jgi:hypothetical protein
MEDCADAVERALSRGVVAHVASEELGTSLLERLRDLVLTVQKRVEHANWRAIRKEAGTHTRADVSGATGDQDTISHDGPEHDVKASMKRILWMKSEDSFTSAGDDA